MVCLPLAISDISTAMPCLYLKWAFTTTGLATPQFSAFMAPPSQALKLDNLIVNPSLRKDWPALHAGGETPAPLPDNPIDAYGLYLLNGHGRYIKPKETKLRGVIKECSRVVLDKWDIDIPPNCEPFVQQPI